MLNQQVQSLGLVSNSFFTSFSHKAESNTRKAEVQHVTVFAPNGSNVCLLKLKQKTEGGVLICDTLI